MFTWNFQYISKARLAETFNQLMLNNQKGDVLVRIHTAIHLEDEAVELARFIKQLVPRAQIFGTSTSGVICWGKLSQSQCIISVTQMSKGTIRSVLQPTFDSDTGKPLSAEELCLNVRDAVVNEHTKLLLTFLTGKYYDVYRFVERCNTVFPGVQMTGGIANTSYVSLRKVLDSGFVFNEKGWSNKGIIVAAVGGEEVDCYSSYATGVQVIGSEMEITDTFGTCILSVDGMNAGERYRVGIGDVLKDKPELTNIFPYVYSETEDIPVFVRFTDNCSISDLFPENSPANEDEYAAYPDIDRHTKRELITLDHNVDIGKKLRRALIYDRKVIADNRALFRRIENFDKAETIFAYSCVTRSTIYSNCIKWELSAYENSNMCGCITDGQIANVNGRNTYANCTFVVNAVGEEKAVQQFNPYAFSTTDTLSADNRELLKYLTDVEKRFEQDKDSVAADSLKAFVKDCERSLLYAENEDLPNAAALNMDINLRGYDRICMVNVFDISSMKTVFPENLIQLTYRNYLSKLSSCAREKHYTVYLIDKWQTAIGAPSYMVTLSEFVTDMERLQRTLFESSEQYISIVPMFCVIDGCTVDNIASAYSSARIDMVKKNVQFYIRDTRYEQIDEDSIRERYHMINVINYAIAHEKVIPYYQGIHDNKTGTIHHYESLMRLEDENGKVYYPGSFLDAARSFGVLYDTISVMMIRKVFDRFIDLEDVSVSINLGIRDIKNGGVVELIYDRMTAAAHPGNFVFEILENEDIEDYDNIIMFVDMIHNLGGKISIDDFGSGYSNLQHIANINCDYLKIDGSIVRHCTEDVQCANLISLISGWRRLSNVKFSIIAEFVENEEIQKLLLENDIDFSQGYLFSKPSPEINVSGRAGE
ncbi:MAG: EAL domain-containing protein [Ruminiclostridium sp.]|nr:EAL domain-containing protein [Ruminiclostridium sp.]